MKLPLDESLPGYVNESIANLEKILTSDNFSAFERITRVSRGEIFVLKILLFNNGTSTPTEISEVMKSTKGRISAILNSLEKKGFIGREIDKDNRRNIIVTLTDSGRDYVMKELQVFLTAFLVRQMTVDFVQPLLKIMSASLAPAGCFYENSCSRMICTA